jgi:hypothetical protein
VYSSSRRRRPVFQLFLDISGANYNIPQLRGTPLPSGLERLHRGNVIEVFFSATI